MEEFDYSDYIDKELSKHLKNVTVLVERCTIYESNRYCIRVESELTPFIYSNIIEFDINDNEFFKKELKLIKLVLGGLTYGR